MKTIIAATDFSQAAANAVNYAADMAIAINADLLLFYSYEIPIGNAEVPFTVDVDMLQQTAEEEINKCRQDILERTKSKLSVNIEIRMGTFFQQLKDVCKTVQPYTVVMGSQGTSATERFLFGSHTIYSMKHLDWPLVTVSPEAKYSNIKQIGFACDFEKIAETAPVNEIKTLVNDFNAKLHVINTERNDVYNSDVAFGSGTLKKMFAPVEPEFHFIYSENTDEAIIKFVEENNIDLLIVMPKRHDLIEKITHKSHTKQFVLHSHVPVMSLHQHA